jgi:DNA-binding IclR family transcriptional regulator
MPKKMTKNAEEVRSLTRGLRLLEILAAAPDGLALAEISEGAKLSKSSTHRLLQTLLLNGYSIQDHSNGHYLPSYKLLSLCTNMIKDSNLYVVAHPHLEELAHTTGETVHLVLFDNDEAVYVDKVESPNAIRMYSKIGMRAPLHCTGVGKAILAYLPDDEQSGLIENGKLERYTENTITNPVDLRAHLDEIRQCGFAVDDGEHEEHIRCIAAPLLARSSQVVGAMSIAAVSYRVDLPTLRSWWPRLHSQVDQLNTKLMHYFDRYV